MLYKILLPRMDNAYGWAAKVAHLAPRDSNAPIVMVPPDVREYDMIHVVYLNGTALFAAREDHDLSQRLPSGNPSLEEVPSHYVNILELP
jgi:hypothetical protein